MSSPFAHLLVGLSIGKIAVRCTGLPARRLYPAAMFAALAPDLDIISMAFGLDHHSVCGHRGVLHSTVAAVVIAVVIARVGLVGLVIGARARRGALFALAVATLSHGLLDAFTACDYGVAFLWPLADHRFLSPFRPLPDSPDDPSWYVSALALRILGEELAWIGLPCLLAGKWMVDAGGSQPIFLGSPQKPALGEARVDS